MAGLGTATAVRQLADSGCDMLNVETGEFYSFSRHQMLGGRVSGLYGTVALDDLSALESKVDGTVGPQEFMGMVEDACTASGGRLVPRYSKDGHVMSVKEASRVSHGTGWVKAHPSDVFGKPGIGRDPSEPGPFEKRVESMHAVDAKWASSDFAEVRAAFADELAELGFDPGTRGNPVTAQQRKYIYDVTFDYGTTVPDSVCDLAAARALSSHEATLVIDAAERSRETGTFELEGASRMSALIEARHDDYAEKHGGFVPATERDAAEAYGFDAGDEAGPAGDSAYLL